MTDPISSLGVTVERQGVEIQRVKSISGPALSRDLADVTPLNAQNGFEEQLPTILRSGDVTLEMSHIPGDSVHAALRADVVSATKREFSVNIPTDSGTVESHTFFAYVTGFDLNNDPSGEVQSTATLKPTGVIVVTES